MDDERDPTEEEIREAEALARALEGEAADEAPGDAMETAALLRASQDRGELSELRERAVRKRVLEADVAQEPNASEAEALEDKGGEDEPGTRWVRWVAPAATVAAAAALMLVFVPAEAPPGTQLPQPGAGLLKAQAAAARGAGAEAAMLQAGMRRFRARYLAALERRYGGVE